MSGLVSPITPRACRRQNATTHLPEEIGSCAHGEKVAVRSPPDEIFLQIVGAIAEMSMRQP
jgi:hypothetical protein